MEDFAILLARHFTSFYKQVGDCKSNIDIEIILYLCFFFGYLALCFYFFFFVTCKYFALTITW